MVIEHADGTRTPLIDASVHIFFSSNKDLRSRVARAVQEPRLPRLRDGLVRRARR